MTARRSRGFHRGARELELLAPFRPPGEPDFAPIRAHEGLRRLFAGALAEPE